MGNKAHFFRQSISLPFIMTVQITAPNQVVSLGHETVGTYSGTIDWGDGVSTQNNRANYQHTYLAIGIYDIKIYGTIYRWRQNNNSRILDISQWGDNFSFGGSSNAFQQMINLNITATDTPDTSEITSMFRMFYKCSNIVGNAEFDTWDTSSATDMGGVFAQATNFNGVISNWNTSLVDSFRGMFQSSTIFNHPLNSWDTGNATDMAFMFDRAFSFNQPLDNWNTSNVTTMTYMFRSIFGIVPFNQDISSWDFSGLNSSTSLVQFMKGKSQANYDSAYYDKLLLKWSLDPVLGGLQANVLGVIDMGAIKYSYLGEYYRQSILDNNKATTINDGGLDTSSGTPFITTYRTTSNNELVALPYAANEPYRSQYQGLIDWGDGTIIENTYENRQHTYAVAGDYVIKVVGVISYYNYNYGDSTSKLHVIDVSQWGAGISFVPNRCYSGCSNLISISALDYPLSFVGSTSFTYTFSGATKLEVFTNFDNWIIPNAPTSLSVCFNEARKWNFPLTAFTGVQITSLFVSFNNSYIFDQPLDFLDVSQCVNFFGAFTEARIFNQPLNSWDMSSATNMRQMFYKAYKFNQPLDTWDTSLNTTFYRTFGYATDFNQDISNWDFSGITASDGLVQFMINKTSANYDATYYDNLLIKWASSPSVGGLPVGVIGTIDMGTIKYTSAGASARASILSNNKAVTINDGGQI